MVLKVELSPKDSEFSGENNEMPHSLEDTLSSFITSRRYTIHKAVD